MNHDTAVALFNALRGVSFALYLIIVGQVFYVLRHYFGVIRIERRLGVSRAGLLPRHVLVLGSVLVASLTECVAGSLSDLGETGSFVTVANPLMFALTAYGLSLIMNFEYLRYRHATTTGSDLIDGKGSV